METVSNEWVEKTEKASFEIMKLARNTLIIQMRFMDTAISRLSVQPYPGWMQNEGSCFVNGETVFYHPAYVLRLYRGGREQVARVYIHMTLHCIFRHFLPGATMNARLWNIACDMAAESMVHELDIAALRTARDARQKTVLDSYRKRTGLMTAEKLYRELTSNTPDENELERLDVLFRCDDHAPWYKGDDDSGDDGEQDPANDSDGDGFMSRADACQLEKIWKDVAQRLQTDMETFSSKRGTQAGGFTQALARVNREKYDYSEFLKKFAVTGEQLKINDDEFDYIFYTHGMNLFGERRMPLIEPLEYKDVRKIREFVIAIDTSGSVSGSLVQAFVQKTYNILLSTESYFSRVNIHIIQCDAEIREDVKIRNREEFAQYIDHLQLKGFGGTDFRPVFKHVDDLIRMGEFTDLRGMIYFTDGYGTFPQHKPDFPVAFVFVDDTSALPAVPPWAIRLVLTEEEIEGETT